LPTTRAYPETAGQQLEQGWRFGWVDAVIIMAVCVLLWLLAVLGGDFMPDFNRGVYEIARTIPPGKTITYGDIAKQLGGVELSRDVGQALGRNPCPIVVPCHRVLAAGNKPGGFSANGGVVTKLKMLEIEGALVNHTPSLFD